MTDNQNPLVSVVIPTYNHGRYLARALQSVLDQTYEDWEAIVIDNHSTDNTDEVLASFDDTRINSFKIHNHGVIATSRNAGIREAKGEWIAFLDSDDWWSLNKLARCMQYFKNADIIYHSMRIVSSDGYFLRPRRIRSWQVSKPVLNYMLINGNPIATSSVVIRSSVIERLSGFDPRREIIACEDFDLWLKIAGITERFHFISACLGYYYLSAHNVSRKDMSVPMRKVYAAYTDQLSSRACKLMDAHAAYAAGSYASRNGNWLRARVELMKSLRWGRLDIRLKSLIILSIIWLRKLRHSLR